MRSHFLPFCVGCPRVSAPENVLGYFYLGYDSSCEVVCDEDWNVCPQDSALDASKLCDTGKVLIRKQHLRTKCGWEGVRMAPSR